MVIGPHPASRAGPASGSCKRPLVGKPARAECVGPVKQSGGKSGGAELARVGRGVSGAEGRGVGRAPRQGGGAGTHPLAKSYTAWAGTHPLAKAIQPVQEAAGWGSRPSVSVMSAQAQAVSTEEGALLPSLRSTSPTSLCCICPSGMSFSVFSFFFLAFLGPWPWHGEVPRLGV